MTETVYKMGPWSSAVEQRQEEKVLLISIDKLILISELAAIAGLLKGRRKVRTFQYSLSLFDLGCIDLSCGDSPSSRG